MQSAPLRDHEAAALAALQHLSILDSAPEAEFDALVRAASAVCGVPISVISLIDADRQWFKANVGLPGVTETPRDVAFCAHAVLGDDLFEVSDAELDPRFADNPLVTEAPHIRFYAGAPLRLSDGMRIGTICVIDRQPRQLNDTQREVLRCLAEAVARALEVRRAALATKVAAQALARAALVEQHSADAIIGLDATGHVKRWNPAAKAMFGYAAAEIIGEPFGRLLPDNSGLQTLEAVAYVDAIQAFSHEGALQHRTGRLIHASTTVVPEPTREGSTLFVRDVSAHVLQARQQAGNEAHAREMYERTPAMLHSVDATGRLLSVSDRWLFKLGYARDEVLGRSSVDFLTPVSRAYAQSHVLPTFFANGRVDDVPYQMLTKDGQVLDVLLSGILEYDADGKPVRSLAVIEDITARKHAERTLQAILDAVPSQIGYWDKHLLNRVANKAYQAWFGIEPDAMRGMHIRDLLGEDIYQRNLPHLQAALGGEVQSFYGSAVRALDGSGVRHTMVNYLPEVQDGEVRGLYTLVHDVTELVEGRLMLAAAQRDSQALLSTLHKHAIVSVADRAGRILEVNDSFCAISGYSREELVGQNHRIVNSGVHAPAFWVDMWRTISGGQSWRGEVCNRARDGSLYWVDSIIAPFVGDDGRIEKYISIRYDITGRKQVEDTLRIANERTEIASEAAGIGVWDFDVVKGTLRWDDRMFQLYGQLRTKGDAPYDLWQSSLHPDDRDRSERVLTQALQSGQKFEDEFRILRRDGDVRHLKAAARIFRDDQGQPLRMTGVNIDVTDRAHAEISLRDALNKAKQASLAKSQFLANMSHEIRTPMNAVIGLSYLLERTPLNADQNSFVGKIKIASKSLLAIINDVLDLSKIEAQELHIDRAPFDLNVVLSDLTALLSSQAQAKGLVFETELKADLPVLLEGDATRLHQVLTNLLFNAVKFTERGAVQLRVSEVAASQGSVRLRFVVQDSGIGIQPEMLPRLFTPFAQADQSTTRRFGGTGLGLSIVKQLVGLMGGELGVSSTPDVGSEFWVELDFLLCDREALPRAAATSSASAGPGLVGVRVLAADDSAINLEIVKHILEMEGAQVTLASNGQEAIDHLLAQPQGFDVVLMDAQMPVLDGYDTVRRIRGGLGLTQLPIIALTAGALTSEQQMAKDAGMNDFVSKPFDPQALVHCIRHHAGLGHREAGHTDEASHRSVVAGWPQIEGVDMQEAQLHLSGHVDLFRSTLRRMLNDFMHLDDSPLNGEALSALAARLHTLKGYAGTLGAKSIHAAAAQAERACLVGQVAPVQPLMQSLAQQLNQLRLNVAAHLGHDDAQAWPSCDDLPDSPADDPQQLADLLRMLKQSDLKALDEFAICAPQLRRRLEHAAYVRLCGQIENLQFDDALRTLSGLGL